MYVILSNVSIGLPIIQSDPKVSIHFREFLHFFFRAIVESWEQCLEIEGGGASWAVLNILHNNVTHNTSNIH
jgi:hypothetical protein